MKILTRYIISSILKVAIIAILMFALILAAVELFSRMDAIMNGSIPALSIIYYLLLSIPQYLLMVASISFLFAVTYFLSSLTANNELIPILNAGVSPARLKFPIIVLAGRPYHTDPEINHGIDRMIVQLGASVITEDSIAPLTDKGNYGVLNQWTYHARMYDAARYVRNEKDMNLVQLVSFGCGLDAVTTDEVKDVLREKDKIYTQIKIDEITNLGAVKIRMRSLFAALEMEEENGEKSIH